jgi:hypothetical protein
LWPHLRFNAQNGAAFYRRAYSAQIPTDIGNPVILPAFRTTDRELGPLLTGVVGLGLRVGLSPAKAAAQYGLTLHADTMFTRYLDALFLTNRLAVYGTLGFEAELQ